MDGSTHIERAQVSVQVRQAAIPGFLARKVLALFPTPVEGSRAHLVETCRAEVVWSYANWKRIKQWGGWAREGEIASEADRLPHERAAAKLLNVYGHLNSHEYHMRMVRSRRRTPEYEAQWAEMKPRLRMLLSAYCKAVREYRHLRAEVDAFSFMRETEAA